VLITNEIKNNRTITEQDVWELSFYIRQTYERTTMVVNDGYDASEGVFRSDDHGCLETISFKAEDPKHMKYADNSLGRNLQLMRQAIYHSDPKAFILDNRSMSKGLYTGGMNDYIEETVGPCIAVELLNMSCQMEIYMDSEMLYRLLLHYFAIVKLTFGGFENAPELDLWWDKILMLGVVHEHFTFRDLTLLSGYKTERAVRNLASPSTPENRRVSVIKIGRQTLITHDEVIRWLKVNSK
jgi:hypothetical protein